MKWFIAFVKLLSVFLFIVLVLCLVDLVVGVFSLQAAVRMHFILAYGGVFLLISLVFLEFFDFKKQ